MLPEPDMKPVQWLISELETDIERVEECDMEVSLENIKRKLVSSQVVSGEELCRSCALRAEILG
jgi:hypothetical protein